MQKNKIPKWINIVSIIIALLSLFVAISLYFFPEQVVKNADLMALGSLFLVKMWAARQLAIALIIGYSIFKKSIPMLQISLIAYLLMNLQDAIIGLLQNDLGLIAGATFFTFLSGVMVWRLSQK